MDLVDTLPVILVAGSFVLCFGYLLKEYVLARWS